MTSQLVQNGDRLQYKCDACPYTSPDLHKLVSHRTVHTQCRYICSFCAKIFKSRSGLSKHVRYIHENQRKHKCSWCSFASRTKVGIESHVVAHHTRDYPHRCDICGMGYMSRARVEYHKRAQHEGRRFTCDRCEKTFKQIESLRNHVKFQHSADGAQTCKIKKHLEGHMGAAKGFVCDVCGVRLRSKQGLDWHKKGHSGQKDFVCEVCGKGFVKKSILTDHIRVHTKEKPYTCEHCRKSFAQKSTLNVHMYSHTKKPYKCDSCDKGFTRKHLWKQHHCKYNTKNIVVYEENIFE